MNSRRKKKISKVGFTLKPTRIPELSEIFSDLIPWLGEKDITAVFDAREEDRVNLKLTKKYPNVEYVPSSSFQDELDLLISLGGDGTLIGACRRTTRTDLPLMGVNLGYLGFITEFNTTSIKSDIETVLNGKYKVEDVTLYRADIIKDNKVVFSDDFLNDAVIGKCDVRRMFEISIDTEDEHIYKLVGDGLIISSPIGSTAYSLSAGGPIMHRSVRSLALTPICPHSLSRRPIVIPDDFKISITPRAKDYPLNLTLDGQSSQNINEDEHVVITKSVKHIVQLVTNPERGYFKTLREKFTNCPRDFMP